MNNGKITYPEELRSKFIETEDLVYKDGTRVTTEEIWRFMTEEAPIRFPYAFDTNPSFQSRSVSQDVELFSSIKRSYLNLSKNDYLKKAHDKGIPNGLIIGAQTVEPYHAAGVIPCNPGPYKTGYMEGKNIVEYDVYAQEISELGRRALSIEVCGPLDDIFGGIDSGITPIDFAAPYLCSRCSDLQYVVEAFRHSKRKIPIYTVDVPFYSHNESGTGSEWAVGYFANRLRRFTKELGKLSNKDVSDEDLREEIKLENKGRKWLQKYIELWWSASVPPTNSLDNISTIFPVDFVPDAVVVSNLIKETYKEVKERVKHSIKGKGLSDEPVRLYGCGQTYLDRLQIDRAGGVLVGGENGLSQNLIVNENGDPYENLAKTILSFPFERTVEERALWNAEQVKKSRADGVIYMYPWGCNYPSATARMVCDIIKDETGVPSIIVGLDRTEGRTEEQTQNRVEAFIEVLK